MSLSIVDLVPDLVLAAGILGAVAGRLLRQANDNWIEKENIWADETVNWLRSMRDDATIGSDPLDTARF